MKLLPPMVIKVLMPGQEVVAPVDVVAEKGGQLDVVRAVHHVAQVLEVERQAQLGRAPPVAGCPGSRLRSGCTRPARASLARC